MRMRTLNGKQLIIMEILWAAGRGMTLLEVRESAYPAVFGGNTEKILRKLVKREYVACSNAGATQWSGPVYYPRLRRQDYLIYCLEQLSKAPEPPIMLRLVGETVGERVEGTYNGSGETNMEKKDGNQSQKDI